MDNRVSLMSLGFNKYAATFPGAKGIIMPYLLEIPAKTTDEPRFLVIGQIADKHWSAVVTPRNESIRIISVRRSRIEEVAIYES